MFVVERSSSKYVDSYIPPRVRIFIRIEYADMYARKHRKHRLASVRRACLWNGIILKRQRRAIDSRESSNVSTPVRSIYSAFTAN